METHLQTNVKRSVQIFRTSVKFKKEVKSLKPKLDSALKLANGVWNFDLTDEDKILRTEAHVETNGIVIPILRDLGFICEELY